MHAFIPSFVFYLYRGQQSVWMACLLAFYLLFFLLMERLRRSD
jgi:hypothetical protein